MAIATAITSATAFLAANAGTIASTAAAGSAILGTVAAVQQSNYQKQVAQINAQSAEDAAAAASIQAQLAAQEQDALTSAAIGEQLAVQSASGLSVGSRTSKAIRDATARLGRQDSINTLNRGLNKSQEFTNQANSFSNEAALANAAKGTSLVEGFLKTTGSFVERARPVSNRKFASLVV